MNVLGIFCFLIFLIQYVYTQTAGPPAINNSGLSPGFGPNLPSIPGPNLGLAGPNLGLAGPNIGLAGQNLGIPRQDIGLPGPNIGLVGQNLGLAGQNPGLAGPNLGLVGLGLSGPNIGLPGPNIGLSGPNNGFPGPNIGLPGHLPGSAFNQGPSASSLQSQPLGPGGPFAGNAGIYGRNGNGDVSVAGELPVAGTTSIFGQVPLSGKVQFTGGIPAFGLVTISGQCGGCNNGQNLPQSGKPVFNNKPYVL